MAVQHVVQERLSGVLVGQLFQTASRYTVQVLATPFFPFFPSLSALIYHNFSLSLPDYLYIFFSVSRPGIPPLEFPISVKASLILFSPFFSVRDLFIFFFLCKSFFSHDCRQNSVPARFLTFRSSN